MTEITKRKPRRTESHKRPEAVFLHRHRTQEVIHGTEHSFGNGKVTTDVDVTGSPKVSPTFNVTSIQFITTVDQCAGWMYK